MNSQQTRQLVAIACGTLASLSAGSNYVFSAYGSALAGRLALNSTKLNLVALSGNAGVYLLGPVAGVFVDKLLGPPRTLLLASFLLATGYLAIASMYEGGLEPGAMFDLFGLKGLMLAEFATGVGSTAALSSALNGVGRSFGPKRRATAMSVVIAGFGLSAFAYATLSRIPWIRGEDYTLSLLRLLAIGCGLSQLLAAIGYFRVVRDVEDPGTLSAGAYGVLGQEESGAGTGTHTPSAAEEEEESAIIVPPPPRHHHSTRSQSPFGALAGRARGISPFRSSSRTRAHSPRRLAAAGPFPYLSEDSEEGDEEVRMRRPKKNKKRSSDPSAAGRPKVIKEISEEGLAEALGTDRDIQGWELLSQTDFWVFFGVVGLTSGTGLMYINNVGTVIHTLALEAPPLEVAHMQASLVAKLSLFNALGRLIMGSLSDYGVQRFGMERAWFLTLMSFCFILSQTVAPNIDHVEGLSGLLLPTACVGLSYGFLFALVPVLSLEWFGLKSFSTNNGLVMLSPSITGNLVNVLFGRIYDAHTTPGPALPPSKRAGGGEVDHLCTLGTECYRSAFHVTTFLCCIALCLSVWVALRRKRRHQHVVL